MMGVSSNMSIERRILDPLLSRGRSTSWISAELRNKLQFLGLTCSSGNGDGRSPRILPEALADGRLDYDDPMAWAGCSSMERPHGANDRASELEYGTAVTFDIKFGPMRPANRFDDRGFLSFVTSE